MLSPYRVVDLTDDGSRLAGFLLAQLGAEVIAVESAGTPETLVRAAYGRGKRSLTWENTNLAALAAGADVLVESGVVPVDLAALRAANPALVTVSISPFGSDGPKARWKASDLTIAAASGQLAMNGDHDRAPVRIGEPQAFRHAAIEAAAHTAVALVERGVSGLGQHIDVSAQQALMQASQLSMLAGALGAPPNLRTAGGIRIGPYKLRFVYPAKDGHVSITFLFGDMIGRFTQRLMAWVHEEGHCSADLAGLNYISFFELLFSGQLDAGLLDQGADAIAALTATKTKAELFAAARERRLLIVPVTTTEDVYAFEQFNARQYWDEVDVGGGRTARFPGPWAKASATPLRRLTAAVPAVGADDGLVLAPRHRPAETGGPALMATSERAGRALEGVKILDLTWVIAGPMGTRLLADHGATVVRIESERRPDVIRSSGPFMAGLGGIEDTVLWHSIGAGKHSIQLDLTTAEGLDVARDLVRWCDVVVDSFTPGAMAGLGLGFDDITALNPGAVVVSSSLMGQTGPLAEFAGFGNLAAAVSGFHEITGWPDRSPAGPYLAYTDYVSPRFAALAVAATVDHARRTGQGQYVDIAQAEAALQMLAPALLAYELEGRVAGRAGNADPHCAPHGVYPAGPAGEDRWVAIACGDDAQWQALAVALGRPDLAELSTAARLAATRSWTLW